MLPSDEKFLTPRLKQIARLICLGWEHKEIAQLLGVSSGHISCSASRIHKALGVRNKLELANLVHNHPEILNTKAEPKIPRPRLLRYRSKGIEREELTDLSRESWRQRKRAALVDARTFIRNLCKWLMTTAIKKINARFKSEGREIRRRINRQNALSRYRKPRAPKPRNLPPLLGPYVGLNSRKKITQPTSSV